MDDQKVARIWDEYDREGYAIVRGFLSNAEVVRLGEAVDAVAADAASKGADWRHGNLAYRLGADTDGTMQPRMAQWMAYAFPAFDDLRVHERFCALLTPRLGRDIKQIINQLHWKPPSAVSSDFAFHQDSRFRRPFEAYRNLGLSYVQTGLAIDPHNQETGGMHLVPRSHLKGPLALDTSKEVMSSRMAFEELEALGIEAAALVNLDLAPGDLALWSPFTVHGSGTNRADHQRRFLINGYVRAEDCDRGEFAFRAGKAVRLEGEPALVHFDDLHERPEPHFV
ncbi:MAG: phytanoyl-CoA dioxygenase family protein [Pacificimonas sp.]|jgi:ectoine hydroxylase-related dioxygenase (phytanoyl-CoA dioxygenase family)|nr:phytanoyl-CoA dioxygenase family protein [Pacificimonas sp.]